ncbi:MAG: hypothetical protein CEO40_156 [Parcubacteria group bacterium LiPW_72]|nr:MAG: hypothetical protein CEO40_156 [Parcubacteria group bacterium LiPW_72]
MSYGEHRQNIKKYFKEPFYNLSGIFADYLPVPVRWLIGLAIAGLILVFTGFWGLVKFILGLFWISAVFLIVALIYQIIKNKKKK